MFAAAPVVEAKFFSATNHHLRTLLVLAMALCAFIGSDAYFAFLEDETSIVDAARQPAANTIALFLGGQGQHEHPPLSDLLLHFWLPVAGSAPWLLRLPSVLFYLTGLFMLAVSAQKVAGTRAFTSMVYIGCLWPFAFHFARMAGWYSFCFFLAGAMIFSYFRYLEKSSWARLAIFVSTATLMVFSNYYGWALIGCFALDICIRKRSEALKFIPWTFGMVALAYTPIRTVFFAEISNGAQINNGPPFVSKLLNSIYCFYSLMASESVAPWFWLLSIPVSLAILVSVLATIVLLDKKSRVFMIYFALLFGGMAVIGIINTKRLLFISGWLLLSFSIALANQKNKGARTALVLSLFLVAAAGWIGIITRSWYAAPHFIEPWADVADEAVKSLERGEVVVSNSPSFFFYANYALYRHGMLKGHFTPGWAEHPRIVDVEQWFGSDLTKDSTVLFVNGVNAARVEETDRVATWLRSNCALLSMRQLVPDSGYLMKGRFFKGSGQRRFRIELERYRCPPPATPSAQFAQ